MIAPSHVIKNGEDVYGIQRWKKDGFVGLCKQHSSGDWILIRPATVKEIELFEKHGERIAHA